MRTSMHPSIPPSWSAVVLTAALPLVLLAGCVTPSGPFGATESGTADASATPADASGVAEVAAVAPRLVISHDQGLQILDANTLRSVADIDLPGFNRLNPAGDGRHLMVSTTGGFRVLDAGTWAEPHGDHSHYHTAAPTLTETIYPASEPGHVVVHEGRTALFDDGTGMVVVQDSDKIANGPAGARRYTTANPHHGVAIELTNQQLVVSQGTEDARTGIQVLDKTGKELASSGRCPGVHGEAVAQDEAVVIGCEDGALVYRDGKVTKVTSPDPYGRIGNQAGSEASPIVLGDYKIDKDAELERPSRVSLIDTTTGTLKLVELPSSYTFRSLGRGTAGEALILGTDGSLHVIDPATAKISRSIPVTDTWTEPDDWQTARPTLRVLDESAYITDPATNKLFAVDYATGKISREAPLTVTPNEIEAATGESEHAGDHEGHNHEERSRTGLAQPVRPR